MSLRFLPLVVLLGCAHAPVTERSLISSRDLRSDLDTLEAVYRELHPGLFRYNTEQTLSAHFAEARSEFARDRSLADAFLVLTKLTAAIRCGHSYPNFSNQSDEVVAELFDRPRLPFAFRWLDGKMVVTENWSGQPSLAPGTIIEKVGDLPASQILSTLIPYARADGSNDDKRRAYLEVTGDESWDAFDVLAPLRFPEVFPSTGPLRLTINGRELRVAARGKAQREKKPSAPDAPLWKLETLERRGKSVAYLPMKTWVTYHTKWDWQAFVHQTFTQLGVDTPLIIDLRGNEGGTGVGELIISHLIDAPLDAAGMARRVRFESVPDSMRPMLETWDKSFYTLGKNAKPLEDGWRELPRESDDAFITPVAPRHRGKVVVLIDAANSSATFQFAHMVQRNKLATLVGMPTGGSQRGINGGAYFFAKLPRTKLEVDVPLIGFFPREPAPDQGVTPDVRVPVTVEDLSTGRDGQLEAALDAAFAR